jgi:hypothetical protein
VTVSADADGRRRLWFSRAEIERLCEGRLADAGLLPAGGGCIVDVEALLENELGAAVDYSAKLAPSVLGFTIFERPPRVVVNVTLTDGATRPDAPPGLLGRWRATIAHEAAHILLHTRLYDPDPSVPGRANVQPVRCLRTTVEQEQPKPDWREVQANMGMAALLMPRSLFDREAAAALRAVVPDAIPPIVSLLASKFAVSKQATAIRLETCGYVLPSR